MKTTSLSAAPFFTRLGAWCLAGGLAASLFSPATAAPGDLDSFDANVSGGSVNAIAVQPDGKILIAGGFFSVNGVTRPRLARLNADGSLDTGFDPKPNNSVNCIAVQDDGKILVGGVFINFQPNGAPVTTSRNRLARLNPDGTLDTAFDPNPSAAVDCIALQEDGKILVGGLFTSFQPNGALSSTTRNRIARLNPDGTLDTGFDPNASSPVRSIAVQPNGKIVIGGDFIFLQPNGAPSATVIRRIARLNANGTIDPSIDYLVSGEVLCVALQADGKILLGGFFTGLLANGAPSGVVRNRIARLNADGTIDAFFDPNASAYVNTMAIQADGKILLGGNFLHLQPNGAISPTTRNYVARVNADGTLDASFNPNPNATLTGMALQADGKVLIGGGFTSLQPSGAPSSSTRLGFARVLNDSVTDVVDIPGDTEVSWLRGGAGPDLSRAFFEISTNGGTSWSSLGEAARVGTTADWNLSGLDLPGSATVRARGITTGGQNNGSGGLIEQTAVRSVNEPPVFSKAFNPDTIAVNRVSTLTFTVDNSASMAAASGLDFTDNLPAGMVVADPANVVNSLGGTVTAVPGSSVIALSGGTVSDGFLGTLSVAVVGQTVGSLVNTTGDLTSTAGNSGPASATLTVEPAQVAVINTALLQKIKKVRVSLKKAQAAKQFKKVKQLKLLLKRLLQQL